MVRNDIEPEQKQQRQGKRRGIAAVTGPFEFQIFSRCLSQVRGWSGGAKVSCISRHQGIHLVLAYSWAIQKTYSWARPAILVAGKGGGGMLLFLLFLHFHSSSSFFPVPLFHLFYCLFWGYFSGRRHKMTHKGWRVVKPHHKRSFPTQWYMSAFKWNEVNRPL